ncbi:hypothetical protein LTR78_004591 [Recurvomyces mirabilis]|uniref:Uncharacterized protein n=1 Tax=Recurvomyces mirabilis TaxID=574656 RepID=A0AAE0WPD5_9PEZI|nr:hypothetical protein LTR78_004591 [Recurvomyces mirabilis]KAK5152915.1 hypothetical protein LTS14_008023 [Recurvomyces mirabilis]
MADAIRSLAVAPARELQLERRRQSRKGMRGDAPKHVALRPVITRIASAPASLQSAQLARVISDMHLTSSWYAFVPAMLGFSPPMDTAARAVIRAHSLARLPDHIAQPRSDSAYVAAIEALRSNLDASDPSFVAVGLLGLYEIIRKEEPDAFFSHADGMSAIMRARSRNSPASPIMRAAFYGNTFATFQQPLDKGVASIFDDPYWLGQEPISREPLSTETAKLRKIGNQGLIRLPGLIAKTRTLRQQTDVGWPNAELLQSVVRLASRMDKELQDGESENTLLHRVSVKPTLDPYDKQIVPFSFGIVTYHDKETLLVYWGMRLMVLKICLLLDDMEKAQETPSEIASTSSETMTFRETWSKEQERCAVSIMMFWQDGYGQANCFSMLWGSLMGKTKFRGKPIGPVRDWVRQRNEDALAGWCFEFTEVQLDIEADQMAGGPLGDVPWRDTLVAAKTRRRAQSASVG